MFLAGDRESSSWVLGARLNWRWLVPWIFLRRRNGIMKIKEKFLNENQLMDKSVATCKREADAWIGKPQIEYPCNINGSGKWNENYSWLEGNWKNILLFSMKWLWSCLSLIPVAQISQVGKSKNELGHWGETPIRLLDGVRRERTPIQCHFNNWSRRHRGKWARRTFSGKSN